MCIFCFKGFGLDDLNPVKNFISGCDKNTLDKYGSSWLQTSQGVTVMRTQKDSCQNNLKKKRNRKKQHKKGNVSTND